MPAQPFSQPYLINHTLTTQEHKHTTSKPHPHLVLHIAMSTRISHQSPSAGPSPSLSPTPYKAYTLDSSKKIYQISSSFQFSDFCMHVCTHEAYESCTLQRWGQTIRSACYLPNHTMIAYDDYARTHSGVAYWLLGCFCQQWVSRWQLQCTDTKASGIGLSTLQSTGEVERKCNSTCRINFSYKFGTKFWNGMEISIILQLQGSTQLAWCQLFSQQPYQQEPPGPAGRKHVYLFLPSNPYPSSKPTNRCTVKSF